MADTKKEYTSNLHPKGDMDTTVYPNVKSENIIDKDTTSYTAGKVPDSSLVSKSLDGLNEKIETNKIQTDTNKTNIATLQGDVSTLKQDNETTKTTIAGLVSDNTQNKKDIATLKANTINKDTDASLKSLTLPSASDLKTKDGTSFGGGSKLYNGTEYLPTFDIATLKDTYLPLDGGTMKGDINLRRNEIYFYYNGYDGLLGPISLTNLPKGNFLTGQNGFALHLNYCGTMIIHYRQTYLGFFDDMDSNTFVGIDQINGLILSSQANNGTIRLMTFDTSSSKIVHELKMSNASVPTIDGSPIITQATLAADLATKQDKRFVHTVEIHYASNGSYFCFTGASDKNTPIDSVQDLTTVFANRDLCGVGIFGSAGLSKIHVGSSVNDTTFKKYMNNGEYTNPNEETFAMVFNTTGFTITDSVSAL